MYKIFLQKFWFLWKRAILKAYFCQNQGVLNFCTGVNSLLMGMQKFTTTQSLATKMLFRPGSWNSFKNLVDCALVKGMV
jgi:hypothetical protein